MQNFDINFFFDFLKKILNENFTRKNKSHRCEHLLAYVYVSSSLYTYMLAQLNLIVTNFLYLFSYFF